MIQMKINVVKCVSHSTGTIVTVVLYFNDSNVNVLN